MKMLKEGDIIPGGFSYVSESGLDALSKFKNHRRLGVFFHKGVACVTPNCKHVGTRLIFSRDAAGGEHWDVFTDDMLLMNVDHIQPKSRGGSNKLENLQPMCSLCNTHKSNQRINLEQLATQMASIAPEKIAQQLAKQEARLKKKKQEREAQSMAMA